MTWLTVQHCLMLAAFLPLATFFVLAFWGRRLGREGSAAGVVAAGSTLGSFALSIGALILWISKFARPGMTALSSVEAFTYRWLPLPAPAGGGSILEPGGGGGGTAPAGITVGCLVDSLTIAMFVLVTLIALLVGLFSLGTPSSGVPRTPRFYAFLQLLVCGVLGLLLANSLPQLLFFWVWIGVASWLVLAAGQEQEGGRSGEKSLRGALRMFAMNAVGDAALVLGIGILVLHTRSLAGLAFFDDQGVSILSATVREASEFRSSEFLFFTGHGFLEMHWLTWAGIAFLIAALARMGQFPFQAWADGAAEAPVTTAAMLQGAVAPVAGVYLLARLYPILTIDARFITAIVGCVTLLMAALIALVQSDMRKVLAWSTVSQGGYMLLFLGAGGYAAGVLHLFTHAFIKTSLLLAAGSIVHGFASADMRQMGGLWRRFPFTAAASLVGVLALAGAPWLSGAYSTNLGMTVVYEYARALQGESARTYEFLLYWLPAMCTYLTAVGIGRWWWLIFAGPNRNAKLLEKARESPFLTLPIAILAAFSIGLWFDTFGVTGLIARSVPPALSRLVVTISDPQASEVYGQVLRVTGWSFLGLAPAALLYLNGLGAATRLRHVPIVNAVDYWLREGMFFDALYEGVIIRILSVLAAVTRGVDVLIDVFFSMLAGWTMGLAAIIRKIEGAGPDAVSMPPEGPSPLISPVSHPGPPPAPPPPQPS